MADDKKNGGNDALLERLATLEAKIAAQEELLTQPAQVASEAVASKPGKAVALTGETFSVGGADYSVKYL